MNKEYWKNFEILLARKRSGKDVTVELKNLAAETAKLAKKSCNIQEYKELSSIFYQIQDY